MFFRKKRRRKPDTNPNVQAVNKILLAFFIVGLAATYGQNHSFIPSKTNAELKKNIADATPEVALNTGTIKSLLPERTPMLTTKDATPGDGQPAVCGQTVTLTYTAATIDGTAIPDSATKENPLTFTIGEDKAMPALELGIVGMEKGGHRVIYAPYDQSYGAPGYKRDDIDKDARMAFDVDLLSIEPKLPLLSENPFRISDPKLGTGPLLLCAQTVKVHIDVWSIDGKKIFTTRGEKPGDAGTPLTFTPGKSEVFLGLEQGVIGMNLGGKRNLVVPPGFQKTLRGNAAKPAIPFPPKQSVLVDVEALP